MKILQYTPGAIVATIFVVWAADVARGATIGTFDRYYFAFMLLCVAWRVAYTSFASKKLAWVDA